MQRLQYFSIHHKNVRNQIIPLSRKIFCIIVGKLYIISGIQFFHPLIIDKLVLPPVKIVPGVFEKKFLGYFVAKYITNKI